MKEAADTVDLLWSANVHVTT